ncbi:SUMF1/EgtB/PvdO family nonheme iron enzyme [Carboxylicivirga sp. M1479]|uniref:formylglycine-generating enzyme family protein n=1 Tax=Carboxylicivirga sp. M1479 TaxID=2594476 RepID=UPI001178C3F1|nr:SUMF1/EgtB/PvdO family nonheme iron enzyme [Carboxylicivirga sp. M1479]TRX72515.1 SUMF1/EgtB/PvdOfamily nonheme iron enzyme [Carboxylicivirga sp. M1479]
MKHKLLVFIGLSLFINLTAQNEPKEIRPKGMSYMPEGTFLNYTITPVDTTTVNAFWVGNEVTNSEYAEFVEYANANPNEELKMVNLNISDAHKYRSIPASVVDMNEYLTTVTYSEISDALIDFNKLPHEDYFFNKKYANYPVVGISNKAAQWYCAWKTEMEFKKHSSKGKPVYNSYRLPTENEWIYLASQIQVIHKDYNPRNVVASKKGKADILKIYHLLDNVSEWTLTDTFNSDTQQKIVKGGSWFGNQGIYDRKTFEEHATKRYIGFRVVRPYSLK